VGLSDAQNGGRQRGESAMPPPDNEPGVGVGGEESDNLYASNTSFVDMMTNMAFALSGQEEKGILAKPARKLRSNRKISSGNSISSRKLRDKRYVLSPYSKGVIQTPVSNVDVKQLGLAIELEGRRRLHNTKKQRNEVEAPRRRASPQGIGQKLLRGKYSGSRRRRAI